MPQLPNSLNFEMLRSRWPELSNLGVLAEQYVFTDPESCLVKLRSFLELTVRWLYRHERLQQGYRASIHDLIRDDTFQSIIPKAVTMKMDALRIHGNKAAHGDKVRPEDAQWLLKEAHIMGAWIYLKYANGHADDFPRFRLPEAPLTQDGISPKELKKKQKQLEQATTELEESQKREISILRDLQQAQEKNEELEAQLKRHEESRKRSEHAASMLDMDEAETRRRLTDTQLIGAGWHVGENLEATVQVTQEHPVKGQPTKTGEGYADYVLWDGNGQPMAVIEAKRTKVDAEKGRKQAQLYADWLEQEHGQRPVVFYTNGNDIFIWDDHPARHYPPRKLFGFYSPDSLQYLIQQRHNARPLDSVPVDTNIAGRIYQLESIARVTERFSDKHRKALVVQATGTGKTRVAIGLTKKLLDARWVKRVLFLCDRKELRKKGWSKTISAID